MVVWFVRIVFLLVDEDVTCHINVFVTGSIAKEMDVVQTDVSIGQWNCVDILSVSPQPFVQNI